MSDQPLVLVMITKADIGGAQVHVLEILKRLKDQYRFLLAVGERDFLTTEAEKLGVEVRVLKHLKRQISFREDRRALVECIALLRETRPDFLHTHSSKAGVIGRVAAWWTGVPSLFTAHGWAFTEGAPAVQRVYGLVVESFLCRLIGKVVTISEYDYRLANRYRVGSPKKRYLVKNGISKPLIDKQPDHHSVLQILAIGRLSPVKNHAMLLEALALLDIPYYARIIGEGECKQALKSRIEALGLSDRVELLGEVIETSEYMAVSDLFVMGSNYEGLPLSVLEAMSMGLPVLSTDVGGVSEAVLHDRTGLLSQRGDIKQLAANIKLLAADQGKMKRYGEQGMAHYRKNFTADRMIVELVPVYREMVRD